VAAPLTTLTRVKLIAQDDAFIQALTDSDPLVEMIMDDVARHIVVEKFGADTEAAQRYCVAHWLSLAAQPVGGRGPLSSISIGGISRSFTLPYLNQKTVYGATQFGLMYLEFLWRNQIPFVVFQAPSSSDGIA
jgi:hypothetical protein